MTGERIMQDSEAWKKLNDSRGTSIGGQKSSKTIKLKRTDIKF